MKFNKIAVLTSENSWLSPYSRKFVEILKDKGYNAKYFNNYESIDNDYEVVFILSYFNIIKKNSLKKHKHNMVIHESNLPEGRGWAPLFWQILEDKNIITITLFEASEKVDEGDIFLKDYITLEGTELYYEIREKQANKTFELCLKFLDDYNNIVPFKQYGKPTYYKKRNPADSELDINKSIKEQFNLLRISNNEEFPAFFHYKNNKYIIKIYKGE